MVEYHTVEGPPFELKLSRWDMRILPFYSKRLLIFPLPEATDSEKKRLANLLLETLRETVQELPFLAGTVVPYSDKVPWLRDVRSGGAAWLEVEHIEDLKYEQLRGTNFASSLLDADRLCPLPAPAYTKEKTVDVIRLRANFIDGGLILVVQVIHTLCDGRGITEVLKSLSRHFREVQKGHVRQVPTVEPYSFDRTKYVCGDGGQGDISKHAFLTVMQTPGHPLVPHRNVVCRNFYLSPSKLRALKEEMTPVGTTMSSQDVISALLWRTTIQARMNAGILDERQEVHFGTAIDCRRHLGLPDPYYGNAIYHVSVSLPPTKLFADRDATMESKLSSLGTIAELVHGRLGRHKAEAFRDVLNFVERNDEEVLVRLSVVDDLHKSTVVLVSYLHFEMHRLDWGPALGHHIEYFRLPSRGVMPGMPVIFPRLPDGGVEFVVSEPENVLREIEGDEVFGRFVTRQ